MMYQINLNNGFIETIADELHDVKDVVKAIKTMLIEYPNAKFCNARVQVYKSERSKITWFPIDVKFGELVRGYTTGGAKWLTEYFHKHLGSENNFGGPSRNID